LTVAELERFQKYGSLCFKSIHRVEKFIPSKEQR
jgi:hypothetical protein